MAPQVLAAPLHELLVERLVHRGGKKVSGGRSQMAVLTGHMPEVPHEAVSRSRAYVTETLLEVFTQYVGLSKKSGDGKVGFHDLIIRV